jgi:hypothetical protein
MALLGPWQPRAIDLDIKKRVRSTTRRRPGIIRPPWSGLEPGTAPTGYIAVVVFAILEKSGR